MFQTLGFNGYRQVAAKAIFFRYESVNSAGADESIRVRVDGNDLGLYYPGDSITLQAPGKLWEISPATATATGVFRLGMGLVQSARLLGTVSVLDGEKSKVISGVCYRAVCQVSGAAGIPMAQLWNAAGAIRNILVQEILIGCSAADTWAVSSNNNILNSSAPNQPFNLNRGGVAAVASLRTDNAAQVLTGAQQLGIGYLQASQDRQIIFRRPVLLRPGEGLVLQSNSIASTIRVTFEFEEWPV